MGMDAQDPSGRVSGANSAARRAFLLVGPIVAGGGMMVLEVSGVRALAPWFGTTAAVWTNVLGVVLASLAAGGALGGWLADRIPRPALPAGALALAGGLAAAVPWLLPPVGGTLTDPTLPLELASHLLPWGSLLAAAVLLAPPVFLLGGAFPCFARLWIRDVRESGSRAGAVYALSTAGSIAGTFLPVHVLLPHLGIRGTFVGTAAVLCAVAALGCLAGGRAGDRFRAGSGLGVACGLVLAAWGAGGRAPLPPEPPGWHRIDSRETSLQHLEVLEDEAGFRSLVINESYGGFQSVWIPGSPFTNGRYYDALAAMATVVAPREGKGLRVGIVGFGAGTLARALRAVVPESTPLEVRGGEVDPGLRDVGRRTLGLGSIEGPGVAVAWGRDGRRWLRGERGAFDLIVVDAFAQGSEIPFFLATEEFDRLAWDRLAPSGVFVQNVSALARGEPLLQAIANTVAYVFGEAVVLRVPGQRNFLVAARKGDWIPRGSVLAEGLAAIPALLPLADAWSGVGGVERRHLDPRLRVLTDDRAPVARLTRASLLEP